MHETGKKIAKFRKFMTVNNESLKEDGLDPATHSIVPDVKAKKPITMPMKEPQALVLIKGEPIDVDEEEGRGEENGNNLSHHADDKGHEIGQVGDVDDECVIPDDDDGEAEGDAQDEMENNGDEEAIDDIQKKEENTGDTGEMDNDESINLIGEDMQKLLHDEAPDDKSFKTGLIPRLIQTWPAQMFFPLMMFLLLIFLSGCYSAFLDCKLNEKCVKLNMCPHMHNEKTDWGAIEHRQCGFYRHHKYICCPEPVSLLPNETICGKRGATNRILGGKEAVPNEFPWMAQILYRNKITLIPKPEFVCGGSLINNRYVLTAAHCVIKRYLTKDIKVSAVRLGGYRYIHVERIITHKDFDKTQPKENDIALLRLQQPVGFTIEISPICVLGTHISSKSYISATLEIAGWGLTEKKIPSAVLMKASIKEVDKDLCSRGIGFLLPSQICAGGEGVKNTCTGDSGGPLMGTMGQSYEEFMYLYGITSYADHGCGQKNGTGVYTKTKFFERWIKNHLKP